MTRAGMPRTRGWYRRCVARRRRLVRVVVVVSWLFAMLLASADRHVAECDQQSCAREDVPQDDGPPFEGPSVVVVHAHGCSCHVGIATTFDAHRVVRTSRVTMARFVSVPRVGRSQEPPPTRPPIVAS